jgi:hypothetical protein
MSLPLPTRSIVALNDIAPGSAYGDIIQWHGGAWICGSLSENTPYRSGAKLRFFNTDNTFRNELSASPSLAANISFVLPTTSGASGQALITDGAGQLSWSNIDGTPSFADNAFCVYDNTDVTKKSSI